MRSNPPYQPGGRHTDFGPDPFVANISTATKHNRNFRAALWTGKYLQLTLMSIPPGGEIGLENHRDTDQFLRIEEGCGIVRMGTSPERMTYQAGVCDGSAVFVPAGTWHNLINTGSGPLKLYSIYAPPHHPSGTVHATRADALADEEQHP